MTAHLHQPRSRAGVAALLALALLGACRGAQSVAEVRAARAARAAGDIVVGVAWPWESRKQIRFGEGLQLAADEINAAGGINGRRLRLVRADDRESVNEGRVVAQRFSADPDIVAVIGHLHSYVSVPAAAIYDAAGVVMLSPTATDPGLTAQGYQRVFRAAFTDREVGRQMAEFAAGRGFRRVAIYYVRDDYGRDLANAFEQRASEAGMRVAARQSYDPSDAISERTFAATLSQWKGLELDAIFVAGTVPAAALFIAEARKAGLTVPILGGDAMSSPDLISVAGKAAEGTIVASMFHPAEPRAEVQRFTAAFKARYGVAPDAGSAIAYDAVRLLAHAMRQAKSSVPAEVARALHATRDWQGVTGAFTYNGVGDPVGKPVIKTVVRGGRFEYLGDAALAQARP
jgi:branched-chain amino acid transport system substrate-binding protein